MNKTIHFFDLDSTLIKTDAKWWVIDKNQPDRPIIKITQEEGSLICNGYYKNDGVYIEYNNHEGWIPTVLFDKICKRKKYEPENLGLSFREFNDKGFLDQQADSLIFLIEHIIHLKNTSDTIALLTARGNRADHEEILKRLKDEMDSHKLGINFEKMYFVMDSSLNRHDGHSQERKTYVLIEHLIGFRIKNDRFVPIQQEQYDNVHFYDDEDKNIETASDALVYIEAFLARTEKSLADEIKNEIASKNLKLYVHKTSNNEVNPFITNIVEIK